MTEGDEDNIPPLEDLDQKETAEMAEEAEYCSCPGTKTKASIRKNKNKCPQPNCGKKMTDIQGYESDTEDSTRGDKSIKILTEWLDGLD